MLQYLCKIQILGLDIKYLIIYTFINLYHFLRKGGLFGKENIELYGFIKTYILILCLYL